MSSRFAAAHAWLRRSIASISAMCLSLASLTAAAALRLFSSNLCLSFTRVWSWSISNPSTGDKCGSWLSAHSSLFRAFSSRYRPPLGFVYHIAHSRGV